MTSQFLKLVEWYKTLKKYKIKIKIKHYEENIKKIAIAQPHYPHAQKSSLEIAKFWA